MKQWNHAKMSDCKNLVLQIASSECWPDVPIPGQIPDICSCEILLRGKAVFQRSSQICLLYYLEAVVSVPSDIAEAMKFGHPPSPRDGQDQKSLL